MINKYWDIKNVSLNSERLKDDDLIAYGTNPPPDNIC